MLKLRAGRLSSFDHENLTQARQWPRGGHISEANGHPGLRA
jgi:hypothetical protein